jgi:hypothetical protein
MLNPPYLITSFSMSASLYRLVGRSDCTGRMISFFSNRQNVDREILSSRRASSFDNNAISILITSLLLFFSPSSRPA